MATSDDINKLESALNELNARLRTLETGNKVLPARETMYGRMDREREERAQKVQDRQSSRPQESLAGSARPVSKKRQEEIRHRQQNLPAPGTSKKPPAPPNRPSLGEVEFYCWKEGKPGRMVLAVKSDFSENDDE